MPDLPEGVALLLSVFTGLGLAAAAGFRVFVPLLVLSLASRAGLVVPSEGFSWVASTPALVTFGAATVLELLAYYVPLVDNVLDLVATPAAAVAGALVATAAFGDLEPWMRWTLGLVAGAGIATTVQVPTAAVRGASTATTAGAGNAGVATGEVLSAGLVAGMAVYAPIAAPMVVIAMVAGALHMRRKHRRREAAALASATGFSRARD